MEAISVVELALWKVKLISSGGEIDREICRIQCGADIIVPNILPFVDTIGECARVYFVVYVHATKSVKNL
jgi:hypothetical protein